MDRKQHWERVYRGKPVHESSWHQAVPAPSLALIRNAACGRKPSLIDIGGGASLLVDCLLDEGYQDLAVLDVSGTALEHAKRRLGARAAMVEWLETDVTAFEPLRSWEIWHDRAAFHFLTDAADRGRYVAALRRGLADGGQAVIGAFALDGPEKCSGLDIVRYDAQSLGAELGESFQLEEQLAEKHMTPAGREQRFGFYRFRKVGRDQPGA